MGRAGIPTAVTFFSRGFNKTALAAMVQLSPTSKEPKILAPAPTVTLLPRVGWRLPLFSPTPPKVTP